MIDPNISLEDAKLTWARLMYKYLSKIFKHQEIDIVFDRFSETDNLRRKCDLFARFCYSLPHIRPYMTAWMLDVKFGDEIPFDTFGCCSDCNIETYIEDLIDDPAKFSTVTGGELIRQVEIAMNGINLTATDRAFSGNGGHIGFPCSDDDLAVAIKILHSKFSDAIEAGLIFPIIAWFKPYFKELKEFNEIKNFLERNDI